MNYPTLFEISAEVTSLVEDLEIALSLDPEDISPEDKEIEVSRIEEAISTLVIRQEEKVGSVVRLINLSNTGIDFMESQIKIAQDYVKKKKQTQERLKKLLKTVMLANNIKTLHGSDGHSVSLRKTERLEVDNPDTLPIQFIRTKLEADKVMLKEAIKSGQIIDGVELIQDFSVVIK